jgi:hypothetical protein
VYGEGNRAILKPEGLLTRDPRMVERKNSVRRKLVRDSILETLIFLFSESIFRLLLQLKLNLKTMLLFPH